MLSAIVSLREGFFDEVIAYTEPRDANERILNAIIINMERDEEILRASELIKALIGNKQYSKEFLEFEIGMYVCGHYVYVCKYVPLFTWLNAAPRIVTALDKHHL